MKRFSTNTTAMPSGPVGKAFEEVSASFERFCLAAGVETLSAMLEKDAEEVCGPRHARGEGRRGHRWGRTRGKIGFHGGKVELERPRVRDFDGKELSLPSWEQASEEDWLGRWAMNLMLINVSTRKFVERCGFRTATYRLHEAPAYRNRRPRAASWRYQRRA